MYAIRSYYEILGARHGDSVQHDARPDEPVGTRTDIALLDRDVGAHRAKPRDMQVDRARTDRATADPDSTGLRRQFDPGGGR